MRFTVKVVLTVLFTVGLALAGTDGGEKGAPIGFQAEVSKMLDILINSLYTNRAIFLRELISNGSDALDKVRLLYLTSPKDPKSASGEAPTMDFRIRVDAESKLLTLRDGGVGMTREELSGNLGSLGSSGTKRFLEKMKDAQNSMIGQFGVGFYSVFLVADRVRVASKSDESSEQWVWESSGNGTYYLYKDPRGNTLGRGTEIMIDVKADAAEFLEARTLKDTIQQYSEFIQFPIYLEEEVTPKDKEGGNHSTSDEKETDATEEEKAAVPEKQWVLVNDNMPIWTRPPSEITEDEYHQFYKATTKDYKVPMFYSHFSVEGEVEFQAVLYVPPKAPSTLFAGHGNGIDNVKLYVRRVFITDEFRGLLPEYLSFVRGVVDSNDLPLHVSREFLQENRILRVIEKKLTRKVLAMFADIAEQDEQLEKAAAEGRTVNGTESLPGTKRVTTPTYIKFWEQYGQNIRAGMLQDDGNRARLAKLLRYTTSKSNGSYIGLQTYMDRMKEGQKGIYFLTGETLEKIKEAPVLQDAVERDIEVLFMPDAVDEYMTTHMRDLAGKQLINLGMSGAVLEDHTPESEKIFNLRKKKYGPLISYLKETLTNVSSVDLTKRRTREAFIISARQNDITPRMVNIMRGQALSTELDRAGAASVLEINYRHPLVDELFKRIQVDKTDEVARDLSWVLYDTARLQGEFPVDNVSALAKRVNRLLRSSVDLPTDDSLLPNDDAEYVLDEEEEEEDFGGATDSTEEEADGADDL